MTRDTSTTRHFNIHNIVNIRVTGARQSVPAWLEQFEVESDDAPDITVSFVESLLYKPVVRFTELNRYGYSDTGVVILTGEASPKKMLIPLEFAGQELTVQCEAGAKSLPFVEELVHLAALAKGVIPLHAAAFRYGTRTVLASGFPNGGKTSLLLAFLAHGAAFLSDDWTYLNRDRCAFGMPFPMTVRAWQMAQLPMLQGKLNTGKRFQLQMMRRLSQLVAGLPPKGSLRKMRRKAARFFDNRADTKLDTAQLLGTARLATNAPVDILLLAIAHDHPSITVESVSAQAALPQLVEMQLHEWNSLLQLYGAYCASVPDKTNAVLESLKGRLADSLHQHLESVAVYRVYHPHPVQLEDLYKAVQAEIV